MKTLIPDRRMSEEEIKAIVLSDRKAFNKVVGDLEKIGNKLRSLLPKIQAIHCFDNTQVQKASKFIDIYDDFCNEIVDDFENKSNPEEW